MKIRTIVLAGVTLAAWASLLGGCATISSGTTQEMSFQSNPEDVVVTVTQRIRDSNTDSMWKDDVRILGKTPLTLQLDKAENQTVLFSKDGYKPLTMKLATTLDSWFWGNILLGGFFGSTTDSMTGAMYEYSPSQYFVALIPDTSSPIEAASLLDQREKAREFIVRRYTSLMADLSKKGGDDLSALLQLLQVDPAQEAEAQRKISALSQVYSDAAVFANHVADLYLK